MSDIIIAIIVRQPTPRLLFCFVPTSFLSRKVKLKFSLSLSLSFCFVAFADHVRRSRASSELGILIGTTSSFDILAPVFFPLFLEISRIRNSVQTIFRFCFWTKSGELVGESRRVTSLNARSGFIAVSWEILGENPESWNLVTTGKF